MNKLQVSRGSCVKSKATLVPKIVFGVRGDIPQNISFFSWDKCAYLAGNYIVIYSIKDKTQYFFECHSDWGEVAAFAVDEYLENIILVIAQRPFFLYIRFINKHTLKETESKLFDLSEKDTEGDAYICSVTVNAMKGYIGVLTNNKTVRILQEELRGRAKMNTVIKLTSGSIFHTILINACNPFYFVVYGDGGFAVLQINENDKKTITKLEVLPNTFPEFSNYLFGFVSACWVNKTRLAILNTQCDLYIVDFHNKNKLENAYRKVIKCVNIFDAQSKGKGVFSKNGSIFVCREDCQIVKLEDRQQVEKNIVYERAPKSKFVNNLPRISVHSLSLNNWTLACNFFALVITSYSGQMYYINITEESALADGGNYKYLQSPFHSEEISCLDVCQWKSLVVTCSRDRCVCIWNYQSCTLELSEAFEDEPLRVAFHPNSLHIVILFKDRMTIMDVSELKLLPGREVLVYNPSIVKFNNFGSMLAVCYKNCFDVYDFYTLEVVFSSKDSHHIHSDEITDLRWEEDGTGFATCGLDGRAVLWRLFPECTTDLSLVNIHPPQGHKNSNVSSNSECTITLYNKNSKFLSCEILTHKDNGNKKLLLCDEEDLIEFSQYEEVKNNKNKIEDTAEDDLPCERKPKTLLSGVKFSKFIYDSETGLVISTSSQEQGAGLFLFNYLTIVDSYHLYSFQANSMGVKCIQASPDMTSLFTCGKDKCFFFFEIVNQYKLGRRDDSLAINDLFLANKLDLDNEAKDTRMLLLKLDFDLTYEVESSLSKIREIEAEIAKTRDEEENEKFKYLTELNEISKVENLNIENFEEEMKELQDAHDDRIYDIKEEQKKSVNAKVKDKLKELDNLKTERIKDEAHLRSVKNSHEEGVLKLKEDYDKTIVNLNREIHLLLETYENTLQEIEKENEEKISTNDNQIILERSKLEDLKIKYDTTKSDQTQDENKLKTEIKEIKSIIKIEEAKKIELRNSLIRMSEENAKLVKSIIELQNDKKTKEATIIEKNEIKKQLERENQELEKFKFVLNYKIKEIKQEKDPKENKLHNLEKQAKDMEKEIRNFEYSQANYIVDLSTNHEIMKLHEKQIQYLEKHIGKLKNYIKLFKDSLYVSMDEAVNHKGLKKELVKLKITFLDKEFIDLIEKPFEQNLEGQRHHFESAINEYKQKVDNRRLLLSQEFNKIMRENRKLLTIVNELELEKKEVASNDYSVSKSLNLQSKITLKPSLPFIIKRENNKDQLVMELKNQLFEIEKQLYLDKGNEKAKKGRKKKFVIV